VIGFRAFQVLGQPDAIASFAQRDHQAITAKFPWLAAWVLAVEF
jgi:hypothetical protein